MNWASWFASAPATLWLLALIPPLVLFYFLKLRRQGMEVPSLVLWQQVLQDQRVNSPFQRFKRNLLLLIQLLLLLLLILAALRPFYMGQDFSKESIPILIDVSASMSTIDSESGKTRLELAKDDLRGYIRSMTDDQQMAIVACGDSAKLINRFSSNQYELLRAVDRIEAEDVGNDLESAFRMAEALQRSSYFERIRFISDGNVQDKVDFQLPYDVTYQRVGTKIEPNIGISTLNAMRTAQGAWFITIRMTSSNSGGTVAGDLKIFHNGKALDDISKIVTLQDGEEQLIQFQIESELPENALLKVVIEPTSPDSLETDNMAYLQLPQPRDMNVYVDSNLIDYKRALESIGGVKIYTDVDGLTDASYDLVVTTDDSQFKLPPAIAMFVNVIPEDLGGVLNAGNSNNTLVIDWEREHQLLNHVEMTEMLILGPPMYAQGADQRNLEGQGYRVLVHGQQMPLIIEKEVAEMRHYYMTFDPAKSTLPYRIGFVIMVQNLVQIARHQANLAQVVGTRTGAINVNLLKPETSYAYSGPGTETQNVYADAAGIITGLPAIKAGEYLLRAEDGATRRIGVGVLDARETSLKPVEKIQFEELAISETVTQADTRLPLWPIIIMICIGLMCFEWWFYQRKPGGGR